MNTTLATFELIAVAVTPKTTWSFVRLTADNGEQGFGEATLTGQEQAVSVVAERCSGLVTGAAVDSADALFAVLPFGSLPEAAFSSAVMQAMRDLQSRLESRSLAALLGGQQRGQIPVYANINRRTLDRSPAGFAASARNAAAAEHEAFKIAPFDDLTPALDIADARPLIQTGVDRVMAVRDAIGPDKRLMVDCHWRFRVEWALETLDTLKAAGLHWFECPIPETEGSAAALAQIRRLANTQGVLLAGMENAILRAGFMPFLEAGAYDVMMPDVKYAGGPDEMMRIAEQFATAGVIFSPHNPSGPICHAHSLQVCAALPDLAVLETQFDETPLFDELVGHGLPAAEEGVVTVADSAAGIGVALDQAALNGLETRVLWQATA